eukprot:IDg20912t1
MMRMAVCVVSALFLSLTLTSAALSLAGVGESCARLQCTKSLKCTPTSTGKRCLQVIPLDGKCGAENTTCFYGSRCVRDTVSSIQTCMQEVDQGQQCGLPSDNMRKVAVCEQGKNLVCEFEKQSDGRFPLKYCIRVVQRGDACKKGYDRCPDDQGCVLTAAGRRCQKLPEVSLGEKCHRSANFASESSATAVCRHPRFKLVCGAALHRYTTLRCLKLGKRGENCDGDWRHCDYGLRCLLD